MEAERIVVSRFANEMHALMEEADILSLVPDMPPFAVTSTDLKKQRITKQKLR